MHARDRAIGPRDLAPEAFETTSLGEGSLTIDTSRIDTVFTVVEMLAAVRYLLPPLQLWRWQGR